MAELVDVAEPKIICQMRESRWQVGNNVQVALTRAGSTPAPITYTQAIVYGHR